MKLPSRPLFIAVSIIALTSALAGCDRKTDTPPTPTTSSTTPPMSPASAASK